jgi:uncharacterized membrane protein
MVDRQAKGAAASGTQAFAQNLEHEAAFRIKFASIQDDGVYASDSSGVYPAFFAETPNGWQLSTEASLIETRADHQRPARVLSRDQVRVVAVEHETGLEMLVGVGVNLTSAGITALVAWAWKRWRESRNQINVTVAEPSLVLTRLERRTGSREVRTYSTMEVRGPIDEESVGNYLTTFRSGSIARRLRSRVEAPLPRVLALLLSAAFLALWWVSSIFYEDNWRQLWLPAMGLFDLFTIVYLGLTIWVFWSTEPDEVRRSMTTRGRQNALRGFFIRILIVYLIVGAIVILVSLRFLVTDDEQFWSNVWRIAAAIVAVTGSWFTIHLLHAEYYAHKYYSEQADRVLRFPGDDQLSDTQLAHGYTDFAYFALAVGSAFGTTDVQVEGQRMRRAVLFHAVISFWFAVGIIAVLFALISQ